MKLMLNLIVSCNKSFTFPLLFLERNIFTNKNVNARSNPEFVK